MGSGESKSTHSGARPRARRPPPNRNAHAPRPEMTRARPREMTPPPELKKPWRTLTWEEKYEIMKEFDHFVPSSKSKNLRILLYGPAGAGKSCFINSVQRVLLGRNSAGALEHGAHSGTSFTRTITSHRLKLPDGEHLPVVFTDITGLEPGDGKGIQPNDIIKVLHGYIADGYRFKPEHPITKEDPRYIQQPQLHQKVHCLVSVIPANSPKTFEKVFRKMMIVRKKAAELNIPQVIVLTKVDRACAMVQHDLKMIYHSRKIREMVHICQTSLDIPLHTIYPVKNYHQEISQNEDNDVLILMALRDILNFANDYVEAKVVARPAKK